ncbi:MAG: ATP-binding protein [Myxococcota bacterium]
MELEQEVSAEQDRLLFRQGRVGNGGNLIVAVAMIPILSWGGADLLGLVPIFGVILTGLGRALLLRRVSSRPRADAELVRCRRIYIALTLAMGICWGGVGSLTYGQLAPAHQFLIVAMGFGMTAAGVSTLAYVLAAHLAYMVPFILGITLGVGLYGMNGARWIAFIIPFFVLVMTRTGREQRRTLFESTRLSVENRHLVSALRAERDGAEEARRRAESANEAKTEFLAKMSHEIRTPMNGILGMTELMLTGNLPSEERFFAETAHHSGQTLLAILNDILDFSKIEAGKLSVEANPVNLEELVEEVVALFGISATKKGLRLDYRLDPTLPPVVMGDAVRLRQILANLVGNAIKFTASGSVSIDVEAKDGAQRFAVRDTGLGIAPEDQTRLFRQFEQVSGTISRRFGGTGLGLAISKQLVELMGGSVHLESAVGAGSVFSFTLRLPAGPPPPPRARDLVGRSIAILAPHPRDAAALQQWVEARGAQAVLLPEASALARSRGFDQAIVDGQALSEFGSILDAQPELRILVFEPPSQLTGAESHPRCARLGSPLRRSQVEAHLGPAPSTTPESTRSRRFAGAKLLVADDNAVNRAVVGGMLSRFGCETQLVQSGREALEALQRSSFDLVLMDCEMPELDGLSATQLRRADERAQGLQHQPIVALTAHALEAYQLRCTEAGMDDILTKPVSIAGLERCLERWLPAPASPLAPPTPAPTTSRWSGGY